MTADTLACDELVELVTGYLDDDLDPELRARIDAHLLECDGCLTYLEQVRSTIDVLGRARVDHLDPEFRERLLDAFGGWTRPPGSGSENS